MLVLNDSYIYIRMRQLKLYLQEIDKKESSIDHIGLIMKYHLNQKLYEKQLSKENADETEFKINNIIALKSKKKKNAKGGFR